MKPLKKDWVFFICMILILSSIGYVTYFYTTQKINSCTSDPLKFAINKIKSENVGIDRISGGLTITTLSGQTLYHDFGESIISNNNQSINFSK